MKSSQRTILGGFTVGLVVGASVLAAFGQAKKTTASAQATVAPRLGVQWDSNQNLLLVTDNKFSQLYLYRNAKGSSGLQLQSIIDLRFTGKALLPTRVPGATKAATKKPAKRKPSTKKPATRKPKTKKKTTTKKPG